MSRIYIFPTISFVEQLYQRNLFPSLINQYTLNYKDIYSHKPCNQYILLLYQHHGWRERELMEEGGIEPDDPVLAEINKRLIIKCDNGLELIK